MKSTFSKTLPARSFAGLLLSAGIVMSPMPGHGQSVSAEGGKGWFLVTLIPAVADAIKAAFSSSVGQGATCIFGNLLSFSGAQANYNCKPAVNPQTVNNVPNNGGAFVAGGVPTPAAPIAPGVAQNLSTQPVLSFVVKKLANQHPRGAEVGQLVSGPLQQGGAPSFTLKTGEAFAIAFATSVPGRVKLINTDATGAVSSSPTYEAIPGNDNRMPRELEGGILMTGTPGTEYMDVEFTPCVSASLTQDARVAGFSGHLPPCSAGVAVKQYRPALANGEGGVADFGGKAMQFPASGDPSQPVAIAPANYAKGEQLRFRIVINHVPGGF
jgi:hypothetical protein